MTGDLCEKCGSREGIMTRRTVVDRWLCTACRAEETVTNLLKHGPKCPDCGGVMGTSRDIYRSASRAHCNDCGLHIVADDNGKVTRVRTTPPDILCSSCGEPLKQNLDAFECRPCGRSVTA